MSNVTDRSKRIGISLASFFPFGAFQPDRAIKAAKLAGYAFCQAMPTRMLGRMDQSALWLMFQPPLMYIEESWDYADSLTQVIRDMRAKKTDAPTLIDWALFPSQSKSSNFFSVLEHVYLTPNTPDVKIPYVIRRSFETLNRDELIEIHPDMNLHLDEVLGLAQLHHEITPHPLVLDLWHLRRPKGGGRIGTPQILAPGQVTDEYPLGKWEDSLPKLLPYTSVIHVSPRRDKPEFEEFVRGIYTELHDMLHLIRDQGYAGDMVVEATPSSTLGKFQFAQHCRNLSLFREWIEKTIHQKSTSAS